MYWQSQVFHVLTISGISCTNILRYFMYWQSQVFHVLAVSGISCTDSLRYFMYWQFQVFYVLAFSGISCTGNLRYFMYWQSQIFHVLPISGILCTANRSLTGSGNPLFESCVEGKAQQREIQVYSKSTYQIHSPNLPYSEGIGSPAAAILLLKVM